MATTVLLLLVLWFVTLLLADSACQNAHRKGVAEARKAATDAMAVHFAAYGIDDDGESFEERVRQLLAAVAMKREDAVREAYASQRERAARDEQAKQLREKEAQEKQDAERIKWASEYQHSDLDDAMALDSARRLVESAHFADIRDHSSLRWVSFLPMAAALVKRADFPLKGAAIATEDEADIVGATVIGFERRPDGAYTIDLSTSHRIHTTVDLAQRRGTELLAVDVWRDDAAGQLHIVHTNTGGYHRHDRPSTARRELVARADLERALTFATPLRPVRG